MSKFQGLKDFINQRLNAAVEEIFGQVERTIAEYEEEMDRRHQKLDTSLTAQVELKGPVIQQLFVVLQEVAPEQQDCSSILAQNDPEPPHIKEEQVDIRTSQEVEQLPGLEVEQLPGLEEADSTNFPLTSVPVKNEVDEEKPQSSQPHQRQTEHMETESAEEDCGGPGSGSGSGSDDKTEHSSESYTDDSDDDKECKWTRKSQSVQKNKDPVKEGRCVTDHKLSCTECGKSFGNKPSLRVHMLIHRKGKFCCTTCLKIFSEKKLLIRHMEDHTNKKTYSCSLCCRRFRDQGAVEVHMKRHSKGKKKIEIS